MAISELEVLGRLASEGRVSAQVPNIHYVFGREQADKAIEFDQKVRDMIDQGLLAWTLFNPQPGLKHVYTHEPRSPHSNRVLSAYLAMTQLAVAQHVKDLYTIFEQGTAKTGRVLVDFSSFETKLWAEAAPVNPSFQQQLISLVGPDGAAAKAKPKTNYTKLGADGFVEVISNRKFNMLREMSNQNSAVFTAWLDKNKIGPDTKRQGEGLGGTRFIEHVVVSDAGVAGIDWAVSKGFTPNFDWYRMGAQNRPDVLEVWKHLESLGVDPKQSNDSGTLWHVATQSHFDDLDGAYNWIRTRNVDWNVVDSQGALPIEKLIRDVMSAHAQDEFLSGGTMGRMIMAMGQAAGAFSGNEINQEKRELLVKKNLVLEMVRSGVVLTKKDQDGNSVAKSIFPGQLSAERYLSEIGGNLFTCNHDVLCRTPEAYGRKQLAFVRELEQVSGETILNEVGSTPGMAVISTGKRPGL